MNTKELREKKKRLKLTKRQRAVLVGTLLGDGHLETRDGGKTFRLKVEHALKQREYVEWVHAEFSEWIAGDCYARKRNDGRVFVGFTTYSHPAFRFYGKQFYCEKVKRVPKIIKKILEEVSIAVWYMDDGSRKSLQHRTYIFHANAFVKKDLELLQ